MSMADRINLKQDRRQWLKTTASAVGASVLPLPPIGPGLRSKHWHQQPIRVQRSPRDPNRRRISSHRRSTQ